jgi:hypothetical protein
MSLNPEPDPVEPALRRAEAEVVRHLEEACDEVGQKDLSQESLDELLRLEDELLAAARAVEKTVRLRRQLAGESTPDPEARASAKPAAPMPSSADSPVCRLREFSDPEGKEWRVWEVRPGSSGRRINPERYLGEYVRGWLAFECEPDALRKRLPNHPADWFVMADEELWQLLPSAVEVQRRTPKQADAPHAS